MLYHFNGLGHNNWATTIKYILCTCGFGYVWENQRITNEKGFVNLLIQRMKDLFLMEWKYGINSKRKLCDYVYFKTHFGYETF